jgi:hypothetical protein
VIARLQQRARVLADCVAQRYGIPIRISYHATAHADHRTLMPLSTKARWHLGDVPRLAQRVATSTSNK